MYISDCRNYPNCHYTINDLNKFIGEIFEFISGNKGLYIKYLSNVVINNLDDIKQQLYDKLIASTDKEITYGSTLIGPHRDDFSFQIDDNNLSLYGSQGQIKMAVLALKLAEINVFRDASNTMPVLLLDDLFSELDLNKRNKILKFINNDIQTIITTTDVDNIDSENLINAYIYKIEDGKVIEKKL